MQDFRHIAGLHITRGSVRGCWRGICASLTEKQERRAQFRNTRPPTLACVEGSKATCLWESGSSSCSAGARTARRSLCIPRSIAPRPRVGRPHSRSPCPCEPCLGIRQAQHLQNLFSTKACQNPSTKDRSLTAGIWKWYCVVHFSVPSPLKPGKCLKHSLLAFQNL